MSNINTVLSNLKQYYDKSNFNKAFAHKKELNDGEIINETLEEHSIRSLEVSYFLINNLGVFDYFKNKLKPHDFDLLTNFIYFITFFHDYGKLNKNFQFEKMNNYNYSKIPDFQNLVFKTFNGLTSIEKSTHHSRFNNVFLKKYRKYDLIDFLFNMNEIFKNTFKIKDEKEFLNLARIFIENHHGGMVFNLENEKSYYFLKLFGEDASFILELIHSVLINSDVIATKYFMSNDTSLVSLHVYLESTFNVEKVSFSNFETIQSYNKNIYIDESFKNISNDEISSIIDSSDSLNELKFNNLKYLKDNMNIDSKFIFYKGKTGIGKTNICFLIFNEISKKYSDFNKMIYVAPLNNLIYQTKKEFEETVSDNIKIDILNSLEKSNNKSSNLASFYYLDNFNSNFIFTSSVNFLEKLFNKEKKDISHLMYLKNSIIFIDELQLINDNYLALTYKYLELLTTYLNCKVVIISATIPVPKIIKDDMFNFNIPYIVDKNIMEKFNNSPLLDRYNYNLDFYENNDFIGAFNSIFNKKENDKILIVHNSIKKLNILYEEIKDIIPSEYKVLFYNNNILKPQLDKVINHIRDKNKRVVVFATKKIETGVDVSFSQGLKYLDSFDNIEQFAGRINRYNHYNDSNIYILKDKNIYFNKQIRETFIKKISGYEKQNERILDYLLNIDKYYNDIYSHSDDIYIDYFIRKNHVELNNIKLIDSYEKNAFFLNFKVDSDDFKNLGNVLPCNFITLIDKYNIQETCHIYLKENIHIFFEYLDLFIIEGFVNKKSDFYVNEIRFLKYVNVFFNGKKLREFNLMDIDNNYYDLELGLNIYKEINIDEIMDTINE